MVNNSVLFFILLLHCYCRPCIQRNGFVSPLRVHFEWIHTQTHYKYSSTKPGNCQEISFALHSECKHCQHLVSYSSVVLIVYSSKLLIIRYLNLFASHVNVILTYYRLIFNLKKKKKTKTTSDVWTWNWRIEFSMRTPTERHTKKIYVHWGNLRLFVLNIQIPHIISDFI